MSEVEREVCKEIDDHEAREPRQEKDYPRKVVNLLHLMVTDPIRHHQLCLMLDLTYDRVDWRRVPSELQTPAIAAHRQAGRPLLGLFG